MSRILITAGNARSLMANRGDLITAIKAAGHRVSALVPGHDSLPDLDNLGIEYELIALDRRKMNPLADPRRARVRALRLGPQAGGTGVVVSLRGVRPPLDARTLWVRGLMGEACTTDLPYGPAYPR